MFFAKAAVSAAAKTTPTLRDRAIITSLAYWGIYLQNAARLILRLISFGVAIFRKVVFPHGGRQGAKEVSPHGRPPL